MTDDAFATARQLFTAGKVQAAAALCQQLLDADPRDARAGHLLGIILLGRGESARGLVLLTRAADADPNYAPARIDLGRALLQYNQPQAAFAHLEAAVAMHPDVAELRRNLGNALHGLGRFAEARAAYLEALRLDPALVWAEANLAMLDMQEGRLDAALARLQRANEAQPDNPMFCEQLAQLHERRGEFGQADRAWERMLRLRPSHPRAHLAVGQAMERKGRLDEAADHFRAALQLQADLPEAHAALGQVHQQRGDLAAAESALRAGLALRPDSTTMLVALARIVRGKLSDADFAALAGRIDDPQVKDDARARLLFARAGVLDARGDYQQAARTADQANALARTVAQRAGRGYDAVAHERFVDALLRTFNAELFHRTGDQGDRSQRPVFVFGLPRSGTTLVAQILGSHPAVHAAGELTVAYDTFQSLPRAVGRELPPLECVASLDAPAIAELARRHLAELDAIDPSRAARLVDKGPANYQFLGLLAILFPQATFLHCRRDLRDVAVSCWLTDFEHVRWSNDVGQIGSYFTEYLRMMKHWQEVLPCEIHHVDYEQTVGDLEGTARRLVAACGLEWDDACLRFWESGGQVRTSSSTQVRQPIYTRAVGRWKHYEQALADLLAMVPHR